MRSTLAGVFLITASWLGGSACSQKPKPKVQRQALRGVVPAPFKLAITFDDLPAAGAKPRDVTRLEIAQEVLEILQRERMPPVFGFVNGVRVEQAPETRAVLTRWVAAGERLGSHTYSHPDLEGSSVSDFEADVVRNEGLLTQVSAGTDWHWFRYPFLHEGETQEKHIAVAEYLRERGYRTAEVSLDFEDYLWNEPYARCIDSKNTAAVAALRTSYLAVAEEYLEVFRGMTRQMYGREIPYVLLLHLGAINRETLPELIAMLRLHGACFITLEEAEKDPVYADVPTEGLKGGGTLQEMVAAVKRTGMPPNAKPYQQLDAACRK